VQIVLLLANHFPQLTGFFPMARHELDLDSLGLRCVEEKGENELALKKQQKSYLKALSQTFGMQHIQTIKN